jgi:hypothetical protein
MSVYNYDTLAYHAKERPGTMLRSIAHARMPVVGKAIQKSITEVGEKVKPEREALTFYLLEHAMHEVTRRVEMHEPLGKMLQVVEAYHIALNTLGYRLFNYMMCITTRETRHVKNKKEDQLLNAHGQGCVQFTKDTIALQSQESLWQSPQDITLGDYLNYLCDLYNEVTWHNSAYGGKKWGAVTEPLRDFVHGRKTMAQLLDIGYTLAHNGGQIFDKGIHFYKGNQLTKVLDCQRAGQIPQLIKSTGVSSVQAGHVVMLEMIETAIPDLRISPWVNWHVVKQLGAVGSYHAEASETDEKFKNDPEYKAECLALNKQVETIKKQKAAKKAAEAGMYMDIMPGVKLKKGIMKRG